LADTIAPLYRQLPPPPIRTRGTPANAHAIGPWTRLMDVSSGFR